MENPLTVVGVVGSIGWGNAPYGDPQKKYLYILISHLDIIREPAISLFQNQLAHHLLKLLSNIKFRTFSSGPG